jgi:hypothetical protein
MTLSAVPTGCYNSGKTFWVGGRTVAHKRVILPERVRQVPQHFSWVDHRLVREGHIERCDVYAAALYLFLVTVADAQGLSYYADAALARGLSMAPGRLSQARGDLIRVGLIAYARPLYQVLALDAPMAVRASVSPEPVVRRVDDIQAKLARLREALGRR